MNPITFSCEATLPHSPEAIAGQILDPTKWPDFHGYGPIPGIKAAEFAVRTPGIVGSRFTVTDEYGSSHIEEIVEWQPDHRVRLEMREFSAPLCWLATRFEETWAFQRLDGETRVTRSFQLYPRSALTKPLLGLVAFFLRRAIARNLREMGT
jgi:hypothetical protein